MASIDPVGCSKASEAVQGNTQNSAKTHEIKVAGIFKRTVMSPLFWATAILSAAGAASMIFLLRPLVVTVGVVSAVAASVIACKKRFVYEVTLSFGYLMNKVFPKKWPAYNKITENIYLGRLPLKNNNDHIALQKEGIGAVLSVVEVFENHSLGIFSDPVTPDDWKALGVEHMQVETPDFHPLKVESFEKGVEFIASQVKLGKKVYVHCKAGRGRSAAMVVAALRKKQPELFATTKECVAFVKGCRPLVSLRQDKIDSIEAYLAK